MNTKMNLSGILRPPSLLTIYSLLASTATFLILEKPKPDDIKLILFWKKSAAWLKPTTSAYQPLNFLLKFMKYLQLICLHFKKVYKLKILSFFKELTPFCFLKPDKMKKNIRLFIKSFKKSATNTSIKQQSCLKKTVKAL